MFKSPAGKTSIVNFDFYCINFILLYTPYSLLLCIALLWVIGENICKLMLTAIQST